MIDNNKVIISAGAMSFREAAQYVTWRIRGQLHPIHAKNPIFLQYEFNRE
ncbi:MAG: hypothetical protein ACR2MX_11035 [Cyclobacteriaceae bacterium]